jgi:hypothetical protein
MSDFAGFGPRVRKWFQGLEADNSRDYFATDRDFFEQGIKEQIEAPHRAERRSLVRSIRSRREFCLCVMPVLSDRRPMLGAPQPVLGRGD